MKKIKTYFSNLPKGVKWVVGVNISIYIVTIIVSLVFGVSLQDYLGAYPTYSENFSVFTIFTSMFVHSMNYIHITSNMLLMLVFAPFVENKLGSKNFIISYFLIGIMGYVSVNYSYHINKLKIEESIQNIGLDVDDIKVVNGKVSNDYISSLNKDQLNFVKDYNHVISKTYGASSALFGIITLYLLFNLLTFKKVLFNLLTIYFIVDVVFEVFNSDFILNGGQYAHFGGIICGVVVFIVYKTKKGIV